jgi:CRP-like cAMP-binding protein
VADIRLVSHPIFEGIDKPVLNDVLDQTRVTRKDVPAGALYRLQGESYDELSLLVAGRLEAGIEDASGRRLLVETLVAPQTLAGAVLFTEDPRLPVTLTATEDATVYEIAREALAALADRFPVIYRRLLHDAGSRIDFL